MGRQRQWLSLEITDRKSRTPIISSVGSRLTRHSLTTGWHALPELVDKYHPDFLYFDWWIGQPAFQPYLQRFAAYYYNEAARRRQGVVMTYKQHDFPENAAVLDIERGKLDALRLLPSLAD